MVRKAEVDWLFLVWQVFDFRYTNPPYGGTENTWFYRLDMPEGYKHFSKTKPMKPEHFNPVIEWWDNRRDISEDSFEKSKCYSVQEITDRNHNIDLNQKRSTLRNAKLFNFHSARK